MYTSVFIHISVQIVLAGCVTVMTRSVTNDITAKKKIELKPYEIQCGLTDLLIISAPIVISSDTRYSLNKPNGEVIKLNLSKPIYREDKFSNITYINEYSNIEAKFFLNQSPIISPVYKYEVFNTNKGQTWNSSDIFDEKRNAMNANDFMIGPLDYDDYGNWVLSVFYEDEFHEWIEAFQVISVQIEENVPAVPASHTLKPGQSFEIKFAYPIKYLESCELNTPRGSFDRFYKRSRIDMASCGYIVENVTTDDEGVWRLIGVGKIAHISTMYLNVEQ